MESYNDTLRQGDHVGCYQIEQVLGRGGFAATYLAHDLHLDVQVALKEYLPRDIVRRDENLNVVPASDELADDYDAGLHNFAREAKTLARFKHPNIVRVHNVLHQYQTAYMVMDYEQGHELSRLLDQPGALSEAELLAIVAPVLDGLEEIHRHGYLHRDIKPSNIYLRNDAPPVLLDFGAARFAMSEATQQLTAVVTVGYTPIEQYNISQEDQGPWSDIYALAAVLYEAVTGEMPVDSITRATALQVKRDIDPLITTRSAAQQPYSAGFLDAIDWGLQFRAEDRPQTVEQWRAAILATSTGQPATATQRKRDTAPYPEPRTTPRPDSGSRPDTGPQIDFGNLSDDTDEFDMPVLDDITVARPRKVDSGDVTKAASPGPAVSRPAPPRRHNTQEVREVVKRDIMGRGQQQEPLPEPLDLTNDGDFADVEQVPRRAAPKSAAIRPKQLAPRNFEPDDDDRNWEIPQPSRLAGLRWILPTVALTSIIGGALYYVNQPTPRPPVSSAAPTFDIAAALASGRALEDTGDGVFPIEYSALDYYRQVLQREPDNPDALAGIARIEKNLIRSIDAGVEANELARVNRLLARANASGLDISVERTEAPQSADAPIAAIRAHLANDQLADALALFERHKQTLSADAIAEIDAAIATRQSASTDLTVVDPPAPTPIEQPASLPPAVAPQPLPPSASSAPPPATQTPSAAIAPPPKGATIATGSLARHLEKLRLAIEARGIDEVLASSDMSADRERFLRRMFERYDHLSVTIDQVQQSSRGANAKLNIAMYNKRRDGSFYSAGRWNGVTLNTAQDAAGRWGSIRW